MAAPLHGNLAAMGRPGSSPCTTSTSSAVRGGGPRQVGSAVGIRNVAATTAAAGRRGLLSFILLSTSTATDSKSALLQEYRRRSKENKEKNDRERLDDYYKRNYKDYFEFVEGSDEGKSEEELSESEKGIREWLKKNRK